jgi:very-short-patch-repair endonuclease
MTTKSGAQRGEVLVAIMNSKRDFAILQDKHWYRIPVDTAPRRWPPRWLALYQTKVFDEERWSVNYYGRVRDVCIRRGQELELYEPPHPKANRRYYQVHLESIERLAQPILSRRWRRIVFIPTTWTKFTSAVEINDLFDESPLEDRLWAELKRLKIAAERQWDVNIGQAWYKLDFALFCEKGPLDLETDGDAWHVGPESSDQDNVRDNDLKAAGWQVMRFTGRQIREQLTDYCMHKITEMINRLDGLKEEGLVPRTFHQRGDGLAQQLSLFEGDVGYDVDPRSKQARRT